METGWEKYNGIHPGLTLERELKKRHLKKGPFALSIGEYPQSLNEITKGRRGLTPALALKLDRVLGIAEDTMYLLQAAYDLKQAKEKERRPGPKLRDILFWDTDINKIDWHRQKRAVIHRVFERGNEDERAEVIHYYGAETVRLAFGGAADICTSLQATRRTT
jgi:addiction module HigA family antidote